MHWEWWNNGKQTTEVRAQKDINNHAELREWAWEVHEEHPSPRGAQWLFVTEESPLFAWTEVR